MLHTKFKLLVNKECFLLINILKVTKLKLYFIDCDKQSEMHKLVSHTNGGIRWGVCVKPDQCNCSKKIGHTYRIFHNTYCKLFEHGLKIELKNITYTPVPVVEK